MKATTDIDEAKERISLKIDQAINAILAAEKEMREMVDATREPNSEEHQR